MQSQPMRHGFPPHALEAGVATLAVALVHADTERVYATPAMAEDWRDDQGRIIFGTIVLE
jgi:hypothetical protein